MKTLLVCGVGGSLAAGNMASDSSEEEDEERIWESPSGSACAVLCVRLFFPDEMSIEMVYLTCSQVSHGNEVNILLFIKRS